MTDRRTSATTALVVTSGTVVLLSYLVLSFDVHRYEVWCLGGELIGKDGVRLQTRSNNCGPAALMMILDHYDIPSTTDEIERHVRLTARGSTMLSLQEMAELKGLTATGWRLSVEELASRPLPALLFVHRDHFVVADSVCGGQVFLRDPAIGRIRMPERKLMHIWNGETLLFGRQ